GASKEATGVHPVEGEGILVVGGVEPHSSDADNAQGEGPTAEFELEALSLENVELVTGCSITQVWLVWPPLPYFLASLLNTNLAFLYPAASRRPVLLLLSHRGAERPCCNGRAEQGHPCHIEGGLRLVLEPG
ncbi:hypothetical protein PanWU01x14_059720, partial [Parasponia andersonii]